MTRAPHQFAPSWLSRQQRRHVDRALRKLFQRGVCSICGGPFKPGSSTAAGFDAYGTVVLAGECCISRVAKLFMLGLELSEQIAAAHQKAAVDEMLDIAKRHGGLGCPVEVNLRDSPWKKADCEWFERNPKRAHRMRMLFPGEADEEAAKTPAGYALVVLVQQVAPGLRPRALFCLEDDLLPLPDDEAVAHALFEVAVGREAVPADRQALCTLIKKYTVRSQGDA